MLKKFENEENLQMNVYLKNGKRHMNCDMAVANETVGVCKFWIDEKMVIIPWDEISKVEIFDAEKKKSR